MVDFNAIRASMIRRSRALYSLIQSVQGSLDTVHLLFNADERLNDHQAIAQYLWTDVLLDVEPGILAPTEDIQVVLEDGTFAGKPHSWFRIEAVNVLEIVVYGIVVDPYFPGAYPQIVILDTDSPIYCRYIASRSYPFGKGPDDY